MNTIDNIINSIGLKIKYYRNLKNISLSKLAKEANISKSTLFGLEEGRSNPTISTLVSLSKTLNIELSELIDSAIDSKKNSASLTLLEDNSKSSKSIYKLMMLPNESIDLNFSFYDTVKIEVLNGTIIDIDSNNILIPNCKYKISPNSKLKALDSGATALIDIKAFNENIYCSNDLFFDKPTTEKLNSLVNIAKSTQIVRAVFRSIYPVEFPKNRDYVQIVEVTPDKETHYYIYTILIGLVSGLNSLAEKIDSLNSLVAKKLEFIKKVNSSEAISKEELKSFNNHPIASLDSDIIEALKNQYDDINIINSKELENSYKSSKYIAVIDEFLYTECNYKDLKNFTIAVKLYRTLELLFSLKERELSNKELHMLNIFKAELPKAYYFAKVGRSEVALDITKNLINLVNIKDIEESQISIFFIAIYNYLQKLIEDITSMNYIRAISSFENLIKELNLEIAIKEKIHPSIGNNGKYIYLLKRVE